MIHHTLLSVLATISVFAQESAPPVVPPPAAAPVSLAVNDSAPTSTMKQEGGNLSVMPTRVVLEGRSRSEEVMLRNSSKTAATFRIFLKEMEMDENGQVQEVPKREGVITASDLIRFSPRQVELAPGEMQTVRVQVRKPEGLADGEYRSHFVFQAVPAAEPPAPLEGDVEKKLALKITTVMGISIPVILRHGEIMGQISLSELRYWKPDVVDAPPVLSLHMVRQGNRSLSGDFTAMVESGGKLKKGTLLWEAKGNVIYTNIPWRNVHMPMYQGVNGDLKGTRVKVTFIPSDFKGAPVVAYLDIPA